MENKGILIPDATCAPQQIAFPQDINLLNEARKNLRTLIDDICGEFNYYKPRMYCWNIRKDYLSLDKCKKRAAQKIRKSSVEFGAKFDMSIDEKGLARIEMISFDTYNECDVLMDVVEKYHARTGKYPERVLVD